MIGVEQIQCYQLVLYTMTVMKVCPSSIEPLQTLKYHPINADIQMATTAFSEMITLDFTLFISKLEKLASNTNFLLTIT